MKRREFLAAIGAAGAAIYSGGLISLPTLGKQDKTDLKIQSARFKFRNHSTDGLISLSENAPPPVLYGRQGEPLLFNVINTLNDYTTMHWHGIRLKNAMDGVPYLTQFPIAGGETFLYNFTSPDAGTFWYHPHCMTMTQMAQGLTGVLVIKETNNPGFDNDQVINLKDFRLDKNDRLRTPYTLRGAARGGTFGNVVTANWRQSPIYDHPTGSLLRLRLVNTDTTRIYKLNIPGVTNETGRIIAWDGHPVEDFISLSTEETPMMLGPGQRADIALVMPQLEGKKIDVMTKIAGKRKIMASLRSSGPNLNRTLKELKPLPRNPVMEPNLETAKLYEFVFGWSPDGTKPNNGFCGSLGQNFWSINRVAWQGNNAKNTGPLATLKHGRSYIFRLRNESPNLHPIHLHGLVFKPLRSNRRKLLKNWTDTILLLKNETIDIALVADNPGDWAFHCHVIEHQKTGLTGFIRVS